MILRYMDQESGKTKMIRLKTITQAPPVTLGRGENASVVIDDARCSRIHTAIRYWDDIFIIRDMNSSNGTLINGEQIKVCQLEPGDIIKIGDTELTCYAEEGSRGDVTIS